MRSLPKKLVQGFRHYKVVHDEFTANIHANGLANDEAVLRISRQCLRIAFVYGKDQRRAALFPGTLLRPRNQQASETVTLSHGADIQLVEFEFACLGQQNGRGEADKVSIPADRIPPGPWRIQFLAQSIASVSLLQHVVDLRLIDDSRISRQPNLTCQAT